MKYSGDLLCDGNEPKKGKFVHKLNEELLFKGTPVPCIVV
jgi:hypothetical protein